MQANEHRRPGAAEIHRLDAEGRSPREIAALLGFTVQSVRNVLAGFAAEAQPDDFGQAALEAIREKNSIDHEWPLGELLNAFRFSTRTRRAIENHCEWNKIGPMTVRRLFEIFISDDPPPAPGIVMTPLLSFRNAGVKGFWDAIDQISELDLGPVACSHWRVKLERLRNGQRIRGLGACSWTKPMRATIPD